MEEFQDIQVPLSGRSGLEQALKETYIDTEVLQGSDQYWCEGCQQLVDAVRVSWDRCGVRRGVWRKGV